MKITDLISLSDFFFGITLDIPDIKTYVPLSNGEKAVDEISAYYTNDYAGTTAFLQIAEVIRKDELITFQCSLTIATKPDDASTLAGLQARNKTLHLLMDLIGRLELAADTSQREVEDSGDMYDLIIQPVDRIYPIGLLANVNLEGHYIDIDVTVPATHLLFPA